MPAQAPAPIAPAPAMPGTEARARPLGAPRRPGGPRARGRRIALVAYYSFAALIIASCTLQLIRQVFFLPAAPSPYASCEEGLPALVRAVERARRPPPGPTGRTPPSPGSRSTLAPAWTYRDGVAASCRGSEDNERARRHRAAPLCGGARSAARGGRSGSAAAAGPGDRRWPAWARVPEIIPRRGRSRRTIMTDMTVPSPPAAVAGEAQTGDKPQPPPTFDVLPRRPSCARPSRRLATSTRRRCSSPSGSR